MALFCFPTLSNFTLPAIGSISTFGLENAGFLGNGLGLQFNPLNALNQNSNTPNAYAVVHIMDEEGNVLETHEQFMEHGANSYQKLSLDLEVAHKDAAYAAVFVANENPTDVYFDDLELKHTRLVWQENAYYPFGMGIKPLDYEPSGSSKFTYNSKELEEATGYHEYGQRDYDSQLGRFHKIDRFSEKYYSMTPFQYGANNPIKYIDVNGDSIYVKVNKKTKLVYRSDGNLYHQGTNNLYQGKRNKKGELKGFAGKVSRALDRIKSGGKAGDDLVNALIDMSVPFTISKTGGGNNNKATQIKWNPNSTKGGLDTNGKTSRPSFIGLVHELAHAYDLYSDGKRRDDEKWMTFSNGDTRTKSEFFATHIENLVRQENSIALRAYYGDGKEGALLQEGTSKSLHYRRYVSFTIDGKRHTMTVPFDYVNDYNLMNQAVPAK